MSPNTAITSVQVRSEPVEADRQQEAGQPTSMENQQEDQRNADQLELPLNLKYSIRDQLIASLNMLSAVLQCNKPIPEDAKERICKKIDESIRLLVELSSFKCTQSTDASGVFEEMVSDQLIVDLPKAERLKVIGHLITVRDGMQFDRLTTSETKRYLVTESKRIVNQLMDLPCKEQSDESDGEKSSEVLLLEQPMVNAEISSSNEELDKLKAVVESCKDQVSRLTARIDEQVNELKLKIDETGINQPEASFKFEIDKVYDFLERRNDKIIYSDRFWCKGMQWAIFVKAGEIMNGSKYLGLFLRCFNNTPKESGQASGKLILFSSSDDNPNRTWPFDHNFENSSSVGSSHFIPHIVLNRHNYAKDDKIVVGVELNARPVIRT